MSFKVSTLGGLCEFGIKEILSYVAVFKFLKIDIFVELFTKN